MFGSSGHAKLARKLLEPAAARVGASYDWTMLAAMGEVPLSDDARAEDVAYGLLTAGGEVLLSKTHRDEFPARGRTGAQGTKQLTRALGADSTIQASSLLAQAQGLLAAKQQERAGYGSSAAAHRAVAPFVQRYFPVDDEGRERLEHHAATAWKHADDLDAREQAGEDVGEHAAGAVAAGEFQQWAVLLALEVVLGNDWFVEREEATCWPGAGYDSLVAGTAETASWAMIEERRMVFVRAALDRDFV